MTEDEALSEAESIRHKLQLSLGEGVFPNWIGPQRFGSGRPVTASWKVCLQEISTSTDHLPLKVMKKMKKLPYFVSTSEIMVQLKRL